MHTVTTAKQLTRFANPLAAPVIAELVGKAMAQTRSGKVPAAFCGRLALAETGWPHSICKQLRLCLAHAIGHDLRLVTFFMDVGYSGLKANRPGLKGLLKAAREQSPGFGTVLVADVNRLFRNMKFFFKRKIILENAVSLYKSLAEKDAAVASPEPLKL